MTARSSICVIVILTLVVSIPAGLADALGGTPDASPAPTDPTAPLTATVVEDMPEPVDGLTVDDFVTITGQAEPDGALPVALWGMQTGFGRAPPTSAPASWFLAYAPSNPTIFIFSMVDLATLTRASCDNSPFHVFEGKPDHFRELAVLLLPFVGTPDGTLQGDGVTCRHMSDLVPLALETYRVTATGVCRDAFCTSLGPGLAGEFVLVLL